MNVTRESISPTEVTLSIEMAPEDEEPFISRSYRRVVSRVQIPGFRRGKAPRSIVESHLGRTALVHEALEFMIPETLNQVLTEQNLQAFSEPQIELVEIEPVSFKAVVPLEPVVDLGDFRSIRLEPEQVEITEDQVNEVIERMRYETAPWEPVDRPVKFGDLLSLNVVGTIQGERVADDTGVDFIAEQNNPLPVPGFSVYLEGMTEGQEKEFTLTVPEEYPQSQYAGKECRFQVKVLSIKEKKLPELDDEFAKGIGEGYESLEALRDHVRQQLTEEAEAGVRRQLEEQSLQELLNRATFQVSELVYQRELDQMQEDRERLLRNQRLDMDTYLSYLGQTEEEWRDQLRPQSQERLHTYLALRKLAQEEDIDVSPEEIQAEVDSMVSSAGESQESMRRVLSSENARNSIRSSLLTRKVMDRLVEIAQGRAEQLEPEAAAPEEEAEPATAGAATQEGPREPEPGEPATS